MPLLAISKTILANLDISKIFTKVPHPAIKFNEKHDGDVAKIV